MVLPSKVEEGVSTGFNRVAVSRNVRPICRYTVVGRFCDRTPRYGSVDCYYPNGAVRRAEGDAPVGERPEIHDRSPSYGEDPARAFAHSAPADHLSDVVFFVSACCADRLPVVRPNDL